jgi:molybdate transport system substrate-binding protein
MTLKQQLGAFMRARAIGAAAVGLVAAIFAQAPMASGDEIKVLTARAVATVLEKVGPDFQRATGHKLTVVSGFGPDFVRRINAGEPFDILVSAPASIDGLVRSGKLDANSRTNLVRAGTGVAVRAGAPKPDVSSVEAFKRALIEAKSIGYLRIAGVPQLVERLGIADEIKSKVMIPDTDIVSELVAEGKLQLGVVIVTQILTTRGVDLAGPLPSEIQIFIPFVAGISANSAAPDAALALIGFLKNPSALQVIKSQGMDPG